MWITQTVAILSKDYMSKVYVTQSSYDLHIVINDTPTDILAKIDTQNLQGFLEYTKQHSLQYCYTYLNYKGYCSV